MLEKLFKQLADWNRLGEIMSKRPVSYFASENARGEYSGWLRTKAFYENKLAMYMDLENEEGIFEVKINKGQQI